MTQREQGLHDALTKSLALHKEQKANYEGVISLLKTALKKSNAKLAAALEIANRCEDTLDAAIAHAQTLNESLEAALSK